MRLFLLLIAILSFSPNWALAQSGSAALISPEMARQVGLERMWYTQLGLDRGRGQVAGVCLHVSAVQSHTVFQISHDGRRYVFSQRDRNAFGKEIGVEGASAEADKKVEEIKKQLQDAGKTDTKAPAVEKFVVPKTTLYATSQRGTVHAIDAETGRTLWTTSIGSPQFPTTPPAANERYLAVCNGSTLYIMLVTDGSVIWTRSAVSSPGAGPALTEEYVFLPMVDGQVETFELEDHKRPAAMYKSFGRTMVQPVVSNNSVAWPSDNGNLYVALAHATGLRFRMKASDAINAAPAFLEPDKLFAASIDGYVYCLNERKGNVIWRFTTGESILSSPVALDNNVYVISQRANMFAIDAATSAERWVTSGIRHCIAGNDKRLYCLDERGDLAILDVAGGSRLGTLPASASAVPVNNLQTDRVFLMTPTGLIQCLREINHPWPVVHFLIEPQPKVAKKSAGSKGKTEEKKESAPTTDPFGAPMENKPAAPPSSGADPFADPGAKPAAGADPFAPTP
jgi:outer membrane protein assembly factor BamB